MSIFDIFKKNKGSSLKKQIEKLCKNEIRMKFTNLEVKDYTTSKIGGKPYLPADFVWPTFTSKEDHITRPLSFFCQINLNEVKKYDKENMLPDNGMLYFFYECESFCWGFDKSDLGAARVFYFENTEGFKLLDYPTDLLNDYIIPELSIIFENRKSYPCFEEFEIYSKLEPDWDDYDEILEELGVDLDEEDVNKLLGYANVIQSEMLTECERVSRGLYCGDSESYQNTPDSVNKDIEKHASDWVLLFQLGTISKDEFEWMFGDCGLIYFYIKKDDLANKSFDNIKFVVQCS